MNNSIGTVRIYKNAYITDRFTPKEYQREV